MEASIQILKSNAIIVYKPGEQEYERCVATANLRFRFSRPDFVVLPKNAAHVQSIIKQARAEGLKITIKGGGHSSAGYSTAFQGVSLDLKEMNSAQLDLASRAVTVDAGCQWGHVYKELVNGRHNGLMVNGGRCPFVGVSGFTLGGGLGPFTRTLGLGSDSLLEATIVTADGNLVTVRDTHSPKSKEGKLFWALRGAGGGNFGVVVQMKLKVHELSGEGDEKGIVVAGRYQWFPPDTSKRTMVSEEMVSTMNDFYTTDWPNRMTIDSTWMCDLRQSRDGIRFLTYFDGTEKEFDKIIDDNIKHPVLQTQLKRRTLPEKSTRFLHETLVAQWSEETVRAFPTNKTYSIYSSFVFKNDRIDIEQITAIIHAAMINFRKDFSGERVEFLASFIHAGGKASKVKPEATAFFWREATYYMYLTLEWEDKWMEGDMWEFLGNIKQRLRPFSLKRAGAYINFADPALEKDAYERAYYGDNHYALQRVKQIWDKDNFFDWEQGVRLPDESNSESLSVVDFANDRKFTDVLASQGWESYQTKQITGALQSLADLGL